ncbi:hypothetical protein IEQ34_024841 [Dendrobium chrysotoxum]|uniref:Uncharacterized protein n=1 Tax=Dendrobium chrysotoxum TaxID=161865 RepID=A0AAV7FSK6_DENCH|nr:hypothetical protein IEQ34_024841 [Dendrobium chrysotoxum]
MSIDLDSFPFPLYEKDREGPEPNQERKLIRLTLVWLTLEPWAGRRVFRFCRIYRDITSPPYQIPSSGHLVHRYYQKVSCLRNCDLYRSLISDHEDPGRASGFHSHHHLEGNSSCSAIRTWSPYHGEGKVTL